MILCDMCKQWYYFDCLDGITIDDINETTEWLCPKCLQLLILFVLLNWPTKIYHVIWLDISQYWNVVFTCVGEPVKLCTISENCVAILYWNKKLWVTKVWKVVKFWEPTWSFFAGPVTIIVKDLCTHAIATQLYKYNWGIWWKAELVYQ